MHIFASKQEETIPLGRSWSARTTRSTWTAGIHWFRFHHRATWCTRRKRYEGAFFLQFLHKKQCVLGRSRTSRFTGSSRSGAINWCQRYNHWSAGFPRNEGREGLHTVDGLWMRNIA